MSKTFFKDLKHANSWSAKEFSHLPWRKKRNFYTTLVSEIMLQQTTVTTVLNRFDNFMKQFPTLKHLSLAKESDLLKAWQGLGYYNRAKRLKIAAQELAPNSAVEKFQVEDFLKIPGLGDYTANAVLAIGFNRPALAIDANVERVLLRYFGEGTFAQKNLRDSMKLFFTEKLQNKISDFRAFHETFMDIGRTFCQSRKTSCVQCPMKKGCATADKVYDPYVKILLAKKATQRKEAITLWRLFVSQGNKIFLVERKLGQWLAGQWEVPTFCNDSKLLSMNQFERGEYSDCDSICNFKSTITHHQFLNKVVMAKKINKNVKGRWFGQKELKQFPLTSVTHKIIHRMSKKNQEEV